MRDRLLALWGGPDDWRSRAMLCSPVWKVLPVLVLAYVWLGLEGAVAVLLGVAFSPRSVVATGEKDTQSANPRDAAERLLAARAGRGAPTACLVLSVEAGTSLRRPDPAECARQLSSAIAKGDRLFQLASDRWAVVPGPGRRTDLEAMMALAAVLQSASQGAPSCASLSLRPRIAVGFCLSCQASGQTGAALLAAAEIAAEEARRCGPSAVRAYSSEIAALGQRRALLRDHIAKAFDTGEIVGFFQPQLCTDTGNVTGFEVLARWRHPDIGLLPPAEFLDLVREAGLSARLSETMVLHGLTAIKAWDRAGYRVPTVAVNFSADDLRDANLCPRLHWHFDRFDLSPARLTVEVLESVIAEQECERIVQTISSLAQAGCGIDLDDFGTGHSSITSIRRFPAKRIKIDRSFVTRVDRCPQQQRMIAAILAMAERLDLQTLAEGVETAGEHELLSQLGLHHVQGYSIAAPMPFEDTLSWLDRHQTKLGMVPVLGCRVD